MRAVASAPAQTIGPVQGEILGGEFRIERELGNGSMGVVYLAHHLVLDRAVAIKVHRVADPSAAQRLLREARAAAQVEHENVLVVYGVGTWHDSVFVAMEYVSGPTAREWVDEAPRSWREIVELYLEAGRGLAAAHAAGLVHRDFKPDNLLVGRTASGGRGRARVADFGLARAAAQTDATDITITSAPRHDAAATDHISGSPAYMAPEQFQRADVDARADQFSFCVALFEALFGRRPFHGADLLALATAIATGEYEEPRGGVVPAHVRRVIRRGLRVDPAARFPDMPALLAELARDPSAVRRRRLGLLAAVGTTGLATWLSLRPSDAMQGCTDVPDIASWWTPAKAQALQSSLRASGRGFADDSFARIDTALGARSEAAAGALADACQATHVEGTQSRRLLDAQRECLVQRGRELHALLELLNRGDAEIADRAVIAVERLTPIERCRSDKLETLFLEVAPEQRAATDAAYELLAQVVELRSTGRFDEALEVGGARLAEVEALGQPALVASFRLQLALVAGNLRDLERARAELQPAVAAAILAGDEALAAEIAIQGIYVDGYLGNATELGEHWSGLAQAWVDHADAPAALRRELLANRGMAARVAGRFEQAVADHTLALELLERDEPGRELERAGLAAALAETYRTMGKPADALPMGQAAVESYAASVGEAHPYYANAMSLVGAMQLELGDFAAAQTSFERSIAIGEAALGVDSPRVAQTLANLGAVYAHTGRVPEAIQLMTRALAAMKKQGGAPDAMQVMLVSNLAANYWTSGEKQRARDMQAEAIELARTVAGTDNPLYAQQLVTNAGMYLPDSPERALEDAERGYAILAEDLGEDAMQRVNAAAVRAAALVAVGRCPEATPILEDAVARMTRALGATHPLLAMPLASLARCHIAAERWEAALAALDRASALMQTADDPGHRELVELQIRAYAGRGDRARADELRRTLDAR